METKENGLQKRQEKSSVPTIGELFADTISVAIKNEGLNALLNHEPKKEWIKQHPYVKTHSYLPIDKVEFLLRAIFKKFSIEILREGTAFNGVYVVVRVHYFNPASGQMDYHDGIGACQLQTSKGTSPADLANINNGALAMAFPIAKTVAIKDACDHFGKLFGADINRKDTLPFMPDASLQIPDHEELKELYDLKKGVLTKDEQKNAERILTEKETASYRKLKNQLQAK